MISDLYMFGRFAVDVKRPFGRGISSIGEKESCALEHLIKAVEDARPRVQILLPMRPRELLELVEGERMRVRFSGRLKGIFDQYR